MMKNHKDWMRALAIICLSLLLSPAAYSDILELKEGTIHHGKKVMEVEDRIGFLTYQGKNLVINKSEIEKFTPQAEISARAREELERLGVPNNSEEFIRRVEQGDVAVVELFLATWMDPDAKGVIRKTALIQAAGRGHADVVNILLNNGCDVDAVDDRGRIALIEAALMGHAEIVRILLDRDADVKARNRYGETALMLAATNGHTEAAQVLLDGGADVSATDSFGQTALDHAKEGGHGDLLKLLMYPDESAETSRLDIPVKAKASEPPPKSPAIEGEGMLRGHINAVRESLAMLEDVTSELENRAFPDTITTKDGTVIKCEILSETSDDVVFRQIFHADTRVMKFSKDHIQSLTNETPEKEESLEHIQSEVEEYKKRADEMKSSIKELEDLYLLSYHHPFPSKDMSRKPFRFPRPPPPIKQRILSAGTYFVLGYIAFLLVLLYRGLDLKPTKWKMTVLAILIVLGTLDWFNVVTPCESPIFGQLECLDISDYSIKRHPEVIPGLYPPLLFDEACKKPHQKVINHFGWVCRPSTWSVSNIVFGGHCNANCNVRFVSWIYTLIYWYSVSCIIVFVGSKCKRK